MPTERSIYKSVGRVSRLVILTTLLSALFGCGSESRAMPQVSELLNNQGMLVSWQGGGIYFFVKNAGRLQVCTANHVALHVNQALNLRDEVFLTSIQNPDNIKDLYYDKNRSLQTQEKGKEVFGIVSYKESNKQETALFKPMSKGAGVDGEAYPFDSVDCLDVNNFTGDKVDIYSKYARNLALSSLEHGQDTFAVFDEKLVHGIFGYCSVTASRVAIPTIDNPEGSEWRRGKACEVDFPEDFDIKEGHSGTPLYQYVNGELRIIGTLLTVSDDGDAVISPIVE